MRIMKIEKVKNGYIVNDISGKEVFRNIQELFEHLLIVFEGKADCFTGDSYGEIVIKVNK